MGLLRFLSGRNEVPQGRIAYHGLTDWWLSEFSDAERQRICDIYSPMGEETKSLVTGNISQSSQSCLAFLTNLSDWFDNPRDRQLSIRILEKAEAVLPQCTDVLDRHFFYARKMKLYYKLRDSDPTALDKAIEAGNAQIEIAPDAAAAFKRESSSPQLPKHSGFTQMCIILQKQKKYAEVMSLAEEAKRQGWNDEWDKRIAKARGKLEKEQRPVDFVIGREGATHMLPLHATYMRGIERGERDLALKSLERIEAVLKVDRRELLELARA